MPSAQPRTMRAVGFRRHGGPDVLQVVSAPVPEPREDQLQIRVFAAAANPTDTIMRSGLYEGGVKGDPPWILGMDVAGVVTKAPDGGSFSVGDRVMALVYPHGGRRGGQAEYAVTKQSMAARIPDTLDFAAAATLPMNGCTAHMAVSELSLPAGAVVGVTGGAGVLAQYFIGLSVAKGWRVIADAADADVDAVKAFGAHHVIPRSDDFAAAVREEYPAGIDAVLDAAAIGLPAMGAVRDGGTFLAVRPLQDGNDDVYRNDRLGQPTERGITSTLILVARYPATAEALSEISQFVASEALQPRVAEVVRPESGPYVHEMLERGGLRGKLVFDFATPAAGIGGSE